MSARVNKTIKTARSFLHTRAQFAGLLLSCLIGTSPVEEVCPTCYRGGTPSIKTLVELKRKGVKTLINVRTNPLKRTEKLAREMGFNYYHICTGVFVAPHGDDIRQFLSIARDPNNQPVYIFCHRGTDRTSFYVALQQIADGRPVDDVIADLRVRVKKWWPYFHCYPDQVRANCEECKNYSQR
jgi:protein tyrosine/serine phosphatase